MRRPTALSAYAALALLRLLLTLAPGYVHPDEFFQVVEPAASLVGLRASLPWEFEVERPIRSWLPATLAAWPLWPLCKWRAPGTFELLCAARLPSCLLSFAQDWAILSLCRAHGLPAAHHLLLHASAWPTLVFGSRTFTNALEAAALALALASAAARREDRPLTSLRCACLGALVGLGCWVRFTFALFWLPLGVASWRGEGHPQRQQRPL